MNFLKRGDVLAVDIDEPGSVVKAELDVSDLSSFPVKGMLYQTGYLTIGRYENDLFTLRVRKRYSVLRCRRRRSESAGHHHQ